MMIAPRVLVVDDDPLVLLTMADAVETLQFQVETVRSAAAAIVLLDGASHLDILMTDVMMHPINGIVLAHHARTRRPNIGVVLTSGYPVEDFIIPSDWQFLSKPYTHVQLGITLRSLVMVGLTALR